MHQSTRTTNLVPRMVIENIKVYVTFVMQVGLVVCLRRLPPSNHHGSIQSFLLPLSSRKLILRGSKCHMSHRHWPASSSSTSSTWCTLASPSAFLAHSSCSWVFWKMADQWSLDSVNWLLDTWSGARATTVHLTARRLARSTWGGQTPSATLVARGTKETSALNF